MQIIPPYLKQGDTIAIVAPARKIAFEEIEFAISIFQKWGLKVKLGKHIFNQYHQFAGKDIERAEDFNSMLHDDEVKAIICARGGYGTIRIIDKIDFKYLLKKPKWIVGYSDITVLHSHIHTNFNIATIHAIMPINFTNNDCVRISIESLRKALFGEAIYYNVLPHKFNNVGESIGQLVGGNLSILYSLTGTLSDINTNDKLLFIEDVDEYLYHIDRMLMNLKLCGKLNRLKGLIIGGMTDLKDNEIAFGLNA